MKRAAGIKGWRHAAVTAAVAYALVLQALLLSLSGALHAAAAAGPQAVICAQEPGAPGSAPTDQAHEGLCCILGCGASPPAAPGPAAIVPAQPVTAIAAAARAVPAPAHHRAVNVLPVGSRAPPRLG